MKKSILWVVVLTVLFPINSHAFEPRYCEVTSATSTLTKFCTVPRAAREVIVQNTFDKEVKLCNASTGLDESGNEKDCWVIIAENQIAAETVSVDAETDFYVAATGDDTTSGKMIVTWKER